MYARQGFTKSLLNILFDKNEGTANDAQFVELFTRMLHAVEDAYQAAMYSVLEEEEGSCQSYEKVIAHEKNVNYYEREIQLLLVKSSAKSSGESMTIAEQMKILSLVNDAERMGDYTKNVVRISKGRSFQFTDEELNTLSEASRWIKQAFPKIVQAWRNDDTILAAKLCEEATSHYNRHSQVMSKLLEGKVEGEPVSKALLFRFHKRAVRHFEHICRTVANRFEYGEA